MNLLQRLFGGKDADTQEPAEVKNEWTHTAKDLTPEQLRELARHGSITVDAPGDPDGKATYIYI